MKKREQGPESNQSKADTDRVADALQRSAEKVTPDPEFVDRLAVRLQHARRAKNVRASRRPAPKPWLRWLSFAGAAGALLLLVVFAAGRLLNSTLPASEAIDAPTPDAQATQVVAVAPTSTEVVSTEATGTEAAPALVPTPVETEPPFAGGLPPAVMTAMPANGEEVTLQAGILLRFTEAMDRESVETALRVSPDVTGTFTWADDQTVTFGPRALASGARYRVSLGQEARAANGLPLNQDLVFAFTTVGALTVTNTSPPDRAPALRGDTPLMITFNYPVVSINCTGQAAHDACPVLPLEIEPDVEGQGMWINSSTYRFDPAPAWAAGTSYTVSLPAGTQGLNGAAVETPVTFTFETVAPRVNQIEPPHRKLDVLLETAVRVVFNTPMDPASSAGAFGLRTADDESVLGILTWEDNGTTLVFTPTTELALSTTYVASVSTSARALSGAPLEEAYSVTFTTVPDLDVTVMGSTATGTGSRLSIYEGVQIRIRGLLDPATLTDNVEVRRNGRVVASNAYWNDYGAQRYIYVHWDKEPGARYCVVVLPGLADLYGNRLGEAQEACFTVEDMPATFAPIVYETLFTLDAAEPARILFAAVNAPPIPLTLSQVGESDVVGSSVIRGQTLRTWTVTPDGATNATTVLPVDLVEGGGVLPTGYYALTWDRRDLSSRWPEHLRFAVVDRHVTVKMSAVEAVIWVTNLRTGVPVAGEDVKLLGQGARVLGRGTTDADGIARFSLPTQRHRWQPFTAVVGEPGQPGFGMGSTNWNRDVSPWAFDIPYDYEAPPTYRAYLHTDRPIYRPGDTLAFHGIVRRDLEAVAESAAAGELYGLPESGTQVTVELHGPEGELVERVRLTTSELGTIEGSFLLPDDARLGAYWLGLASIDANRNAGTQIAVAAYRKPEFEVMVTPQQADWLNGETVQALVEASYYAGGVVNNARVRWTLRASPFSFNPDVPGWWQWGETLWGWSPWRESEVIAEGEGMTDAAGRLLVTVPAALTPLSNQDAIGPQRWVLEATVTDETAFAVTQRGEMTVHTARTYLGLRPRSWVALAGEAALVDVLALDWEAQPVADQSVTITLARRSWTYARSAQPYEPGTWTHQDTRVATTRVTTGEAGEAVATVTPPRSGAYVVIAESFDAEGNRITSETSLWVSGPQAAAWRLSEGKVEPVADAARYQPGDVARILLPTPFVAPYEILMTIERGGILEVQRITAESANPLIEVPITEMHVPNIVVSFVAVKGVDARRSAPDVRMGMVSLEVEPISRLLDVSVTPVCDGHLEVCTFEPGDRATLNLRVTDASGSPVDAEVALAVVDKAVLALASEHALSLRDHFYATRPLGVVTGNSLLGLHNRLMDDLEALRTRADQVAREALFGGIGGGGGGEASTFAPDLRQEFPDTALWEPSLRTGPTGEVQVTLRLPDSLTTWVADARAVTDRTLVGQGTAEFVVTRPLLVRPITPRFFVAGDRAEVAALVHNNTGDDLDIAVWLETDLEIEAAPQTASADDQVHIPAGGRVRVAWTVIAPEGGLDAASLTFSAAGGGYRDAARPSVGRESDHALPIYRYESPEVVSTSGVLTGAGSRVEVIFVPTEAGSASSLTLRIQPTLAAGMLESLSYLQHFPHEGTEQLVSRFLPNVVTARALRELNVPNPELEAQLRVLVPSALSRLYTRQNSDGGWGWLHMQSSNLQISAYATLGLVQAQRAGFNVNDARLTRATSYLQEQLTQRGERSQALPQALALYVLAEAAAPWPEGADIALFDARENLEVTARAYLALALGLHDPVRTDAVRTYAQDPRVTTLLESLRADAEITASGVHWDSISSEYWITWTRATAVAIDAFARLAPDDPLLPQAVRWLMAARSRDRWETTQETAWAVMALTDYMLATGELAADYDWGIALNETVLDTGTVTSGTRLEARDFTIPASDLLRRWPNALEISRGEGAGSLYYTADLELAQPAGELAAESRGLTVERRYCKADTLWRAGTHPAALPACDPVTSARPGDLIEVRLTLILPRDRHYLVLEDVYPAGMEPVDPALETEQAGTDPTLTPERRTWWHFGFDHRELRDERALFYTNRLSAGTYEVRYYLRAAVPGTYQVIPATAREMYFPEVWGRSEGAAFVVAP